MQYTIGGWFMDENGTILSHSAKGSTWKKHLYNAKKVIDGKVRYFYDSIHDKAEKDIGNVNDLIEEGKDLIIQLNQRINPFVKKKIPDRNVHMYNEQYEKAILALYNNKLVYNTLRNSGKLTPLQQAKLQEAYSKNVLNIQKSTGVTILSTGTPTNIKKSKDVITKQIGQGRKKHVTGERSVAVSLNGARDAKVQDEVLVQVNKDASKPTYRRLGYMSRKIEYVHYNEDGSVAYKAKKYIVPEGYNLYGSNDQYPPEKYPEAYDFKRHDAVGFVPVFYAEGGKVYVAYVDYEEYEDITGHEYSPYKK